MPTPVVVGTEVKEIDVLEMLPPDEGEINIFYGRIGTGKTYAGTRNVLSELKRGQVVYANWKINWEGYDERDSKWCQFLGFLGLKKKFYVFPKENFYYFPIGKDFITRLSKLTSCSIHLDEGHIPFDSYEATKMDVDKRSAVFAMRHYDRSMTVYTQRANSVHINLRGNTNRFYKCEKLMEIKLFKRRFIHFQVTEFQDLSVAGTVDETRIKVLNEKTHMLEDTNEYQFAIDQWTYWGRKKIWSNYESKYLRGDTPESQVNAGKLYVLDWKTSYRLLFNKIK